MPAVSVFEHSESHGLADEFILDECIKGISYNTQGFFQWVLIHGLLDAFGSGGFQNIPDVSDLLKALLLASKSAEKNTEPVPRVLQFIERIENADPEVADIDEDHTNAGWGHQQYVGGDMTCSTVLESWECIGNVQTAYRLLAAALKTCQVARHLCFVNKISTTGFLSDAYLREIVGLLWGMLKPVCIQFLVLLFPLSLSKPLGFRQPIFEPKSSNGSGPSDSSSFGQLPSNYFQRHRRLGRSPQYQRNC